MIDVAKHALTLEQISLMWVDQERIEVRVRPRYLNEETNSRGDPSRRREGRVIKDVGDFLEMIVYLVFEWSIIRCIHLTQEETMLMLDCANENSKDDLKGQNKRMSPAYRMMDEVGEKGNWNMLFTYKMKRSGPRIRPKGTPDRTLDLEEEQPSTITCCDQSVR